MSDIEGKAAREAATERGREGVSIVKQATLILFVRRMTLLRVVMIVLFAASIQAQHLEAPPTAAQLREWGVSAGKHASIDYRGPLERAIRREPAGLAELFRVTASQGFDGDAGEAHAAILFGLLQRWGDKRFARVLRAQKLGVRKAVMATIPMPPGSRLKFPLTYASAPH